MALAQRLRELRSRAGLTQQELAESARLAISVITKLEGGQNENPKWETLVKIADALGVSLDCFRDDRIADAAHRATGPS